jgi:C1A family cysteine protease
MKKTLHLFIMLFLAISGSVFSQNFIQVTQSDSKRQIVLSQDQALEVRLPSTPSSGFGWYPVNNDKKIVAQIGNWEFVSDNPSSPVGASGTQISHFICTAAGTTELEFLYKRPWEDVSQATASYKISLASQGIYTGKEVQPYLPADNQSNTAEKTESSASALPAAFSWQAQNLCTPAKNQGGCGSCWAFAACGSFESVIKIWDNVTRDMSEQWLVNCTSNMDCAGGMFPGTMFKNTGCVYETDEPYKAKDGTCKSTYPYHEKPVGFTKIATAPTTAQIKQAIYDYGPVWAVICAGNNFQSYKSGVFSLSDGTQFNHAIVLCGWDDATSSWVLRNSWGTSWGENSGYMRIKYGTSIVGNYSTYFDYKGPISHGTTGILNVNMNSTASVYPNPSSGEFRFDGLGDDNTIEIYDCVGKLIYQTTAKTSSVELDLKEKFQQGVYLYKVINSSGIKTGKLMVY